MIKTCTTIGLMVSSLVLGATAIAAEQGPAEEVTVSDMKVAIDPRTGKLRPLTAAESKALSAAMLKSGYAGFKGQPRTEQEARATKRVRADGSVQVKVPATQMSEMRVVQDADGTLRMYEGDVPANHEEVSQ